VPAFQKDDLPAGTSGDGCVYLRRRRSRIERDADRGATGMPPITPA